MASLILTAAFLLALISSYGIISTEQRLLKITETDSESVNLVRAYKNSVPMSEIINLRRNVLEDGEFHDVPSSVNDVDVDAKDDQNTDDFRPTAPGNSPGAGHSRGPRSQGPN